MPSTIEIQAVPEFGELEMQAVPEFEELEWRFALARAIQSQRQPATVSMTDDRSTPEMQAIPGFGELEWKYAFERAIQSQRQPATLSTTDHRSTPATIPPERLRLASADIRYLSAMIRQLVELRREEESDEYGTLRASQHAFDVACHLLTDAAIISALRGRPLPLGCASTDSEGGVRVEWVRPTSGVHLAVPSSPDRESYIYHEVDDVYGTVAATPEALAQWLGEIA